MPTEFASFRQFYPFYLEEHRNPVSRRLHFAGSSLVLGVIIAVGVAALSPWWLLMLPVIGYGFAWIGHFFFEHNRPATFTHPWYSLLGDWVMYRDMLVGRIPF
jgi:hypothetical protein